MSEEQLEEEYDKLRAENERLRAVLHDLADCNPRDPDLDHCTLCQMYDNHVSDCPWLRAHTIINPIPF